MTCWLRNSPSTTAVGEGAALSAEVGGCILLINKTRQGYAPRSILKPAGYSFPGC